MTTTPAPERVDMDMEVETAGDGAGAAHDTCGSEDTFTAVKFDEATTPCSSQKDYPRARDCPPQSPPSGWVARRGDLD